jgi:16S rRNA (guanine966-N2)-methyltransferase
MRITGGEARGRTIRVPKGSLVRPTTDRVRESLFNIIAVTAGRSFLDIFAGSGIVGLEALSRGATDVMFIEKDLRLAETLKSTIERMGFTAKAAVMAASATKALENLVLRDRKFDIIFADPPYNKGIVAQLQGWVQLENLMSENAVFVLQHSLKERFEGLKIKRFSLADQRRYGDTVLSFWRRAPS